LRQKHLIQFNAQITQVSVGVLQEVLMKVRAACLALCLAACVFSSQSVSALNSATPNSSKTSTDSSGNAQSTSPKSPDLLAAESGANSVAIPKQILRTGINIFTTDVSANSRQLADSMGLAPLLRRMVMLRARVAQSSGEPTLESLAVRQELSETMAQVNQMILEASLEVDFVLAEISAEQTVYTDMLSSYQAERDKVVARANSSSYWANGVLWAVGEAFDIPTYRVPKYSIPSGTVSILAGVVPSALSLYAMRKFNGKKTDSEVAPNMLAKLFDYPTSPEIEYPKPVWDFLDSVPADDTSTKTRRDQLIDRWVSDKNIPTFSDRKSKKDLDIITASVAHSKGLSIDTLTVRQVMLTQLSGELMKMKRLLLELMMAARDEKHF
jgi:hypothetical protein